MKQYIFKGLYLLFVALPFSVIAKTELPDPTRPADYISKDTQPVFIEEVDNKEKKSWRVSAIRISPNDRSAIVNGKLVRVGDEVDSAKILEINPLSVVVIDREDRKLIVRLFNNIVEKQYKYRSDNDEI